MFENNSGAYLGSQDTCSTRFSVSAILKHVYLWMTLALLISGLTAMYVAGSPALIEKIFTGRATIWIIFLAQFGLIWLISSRISTMSVITATLLFVAYSVLTGVTLSCVFLLFTMESIANVFFITAGTFAAVSIYGFITKKDLSSLGSFLYMALFGLIIASVVNWFLDSELMYWIISYVGVIIFIGLTAYDTQKIKQMAIACSSESEDVQNKVALIGAIHLYLDFINLFLYLLRIFGRRK